MRKFLTVLALAMTPALAHAVDFGLDGLTVQQDDFEAMNRDMTAAFSFKPLNPTEPLGLLGFHVDVFGSYTGVENGEAWEKAVGDDPSELGMFGLSAGKGLLLGLDVGAFYFKVPDSSASIWGGEIRYAFAEGGVIAPALGVRAAYTKLEGVDDFDFDTKSLDVSISKGFLLLTPYVGAGRVWGAADPKNQFTLSKAEAEETKLFGGVRISLTLLSIVLEADQTGDNTSFNARVGIAL